MFLLIFESIGAPELLMILVVALIIFGPRKLPDLSRTLARHLGEFRRHSDEFKRTWEREVEMDEADKEARIAEAIHPEANAINDAGHKRSLAGMKPAGSDDQAVARDGAVASEIPTGAAETATLEVGASPSQPTEVDALPSQSTAAEVADSTEPTSKRDWL